MGLGGGTRKLTGKYFLIKISFTKKTSFNYKNTFPVSLYLNDFVASAGMVRLLFIRHGAITARQCLLSVEVLPSAIRSSIS